MQVDLYSLAIIFPYLVISEQIAIKYVSCISPSFSLEAHVQGYNNYKDG